jgi:hypothetical protein
MSIRTLCVVALLSSAFFTSQVSRSSSDLVPTKSYLMGVLGDSIPAGFLADTNLLGAGVPVIDKGAVKGWPSNPKDLLEHKKTLSWASGKNMLSHFVFLTHYLERTEPGASLIVQNESKFGAQTQDVIKQAYKLVEAANSGKYKSLKYLILMVGVNDVCALNPAGGIPDETITANLNTIFERLASIRQEEPIRILMVGVGRVPDLGKDYIRKNKTYGGMTCGYWYEHVVDLCQQFTTWKTRSEYERLMSVVAGKNELLKSASQEAMRKWPQLSIHFSSEHFDSPILPQALAHDCFHPSREGHAVLSYKLWNKQPWFK